MNFPFSNLQSVKVRPALVLTAGGDDVIILGIFSKIPEVIRASWVRIDDFDKGFKETGLKKTSIIKTEKIAAIHNSLIRKEIGYLPPELLSKSEKRL